PELSGGAAIYPESPDYFEERAEGLIACGVSILGGCCGTGPGHVRAMRRAADAAGGRRRPKGPPAERTP
ncbi:MAG: bifunctional homocysteine S-methyltransferase/methylenetetrahydrofolate reductase, partial [Candidatus Latescibacterota bacterium]